MLTRFALVIAVGMFTVACGGSDAVPPVGTMPEMVAPVEDAGVVSADAGVVSKDAGVMSEEKSTLIAALVSADKADGTVDKVITKCAACKLSMDGDPKHSVKVGEYTAHLCSQDCKVNFEQNGDEILKALPQ
jgi:hypothetical protein